MVKSSKRSKEFVEGYVACSKGLTRMRNPYTRSEELWGQAHEWHSGWNKRFWGESINSDDPDP